MALAALKRFFTHEGDLPLNWIDEYREEYRYTPDIHLLEQGKHWFVFEYGEFQEGLKEHDDFMDTGKVQKIGCAFTQFSNLIMYKKNLGEYSYPVALSHMPKTDKKHKWFLDRHLGQPSRIRGDLFLVEGVQNIVELDNVRQNGYAFERVRINVLFPFIKSVWDSKTGASVIEEFLESVPAWIYIGVNSYWSNLIDNGYSSSLVRKFKHIDNRREYAEHVMGDYYYYSVLEENDGK